MKKILAVLLTLVILAGSCGAFAEQLSGSWTVSTTASELKLDKQAKQALKKATEKYTGAELTALALLGKQVVSGMNYCYLCFSSTTSNPSVKSLCKVYVYQDLSGKAKIKKIQNIKMKHKPSGGWKLSKTSAAAKVESTAKTALKKAVKGLTGAEYKPLMVLGRGAKDKTAWCVLCRRTLSDAGGTVDLSLVYIKKSGKSYQITGIYDLPVAR